MSKSEFGLLGFLAEVVVTAPSHAKYKELENELRRNLPSHSSTSFGRAINLVGGIAGRVTARDLGVARIKALQTEAKKLSRRNDVAGRSVGEALEWAALTWNRKKAEEKTPVARG
jgi:hypothetical protein